MAMQSPMLGCVVCGAAPLMRGPCPCGSWTLTTLRTPPLTASLSRFPRFRCVARPASALHLVLTAHSR